MPYNSSSNNQTDNPLLIKARNIISQVNLAVLGKEEIVKEVMLTLLAGGHCLLEDIPGVGKTTMALSFAKAMSLDYKRVQFTPDLMPSDITGFTVYNRQTESFEYREGSVFCNLLLADEINRTSPKTQSSLLEVMEERQVTVDGITRDVPSPFFVIATQNPSGSIGTQHLPEAQVDRFTTSLFLGYPDIKNEIEIAKGADAGVRTNLLNSVATGNDLVKMQEDIAHIHIDDSLYEYMLLLIRATRQHRFVSRGASPRATVSLTRLSKAHAWLDGRSFVIPDDIKLQYSYAIPHRISLNADARMEKITVKDVINEIINSIHPPKS